MPDFILLPPRPSRDALIRFFSQPEPLPMRYAADLLGWPWSKLVFEAESEGALLSEDRVAWSEVAFWLINAWPRAWLLETLGEAAALLPRELHLTRVGWELPTYIVRAMERQTILNRPEREDVHGTDVQDHVAELLHLAIDEETSATFRGDRGFFDAFDYPNSDLDVQR
jgi:hypothetical protein